MQQNHGFIYEEPAPEDFTFGALKAKYHTEPLQPDSDWSRYLPTAEEQSTPSIETNSCVSFGTNNAIEMYRKRVFDLDFNLSDRFVAKQSGTDPLNGNTPKKVADTIRHNWSCFEDEWAFTKEMTVTEFFASIPQKLISLATGRGAEYEFGYEYVSLSDVREALKYSPLGMSVPAWHEKDGVYYRPEGARDNHWVVCYGIKENGNLLIFDTYFPYLKEVRADVKPYVIMSYYLKRQVVQETFWQKFCAIIEAIFIGEKPVYPDDPPITPEPVKPKPVEPKKDYIQLWGEAIALFEGTEPHHPSVKNKNPGNIKGLDKKFLVFKTREEGFAYLKDYLHRACTGDHKAYRPDMTLKQAMRVYALEGNEPNAEEILTNYSNHCAKHMGVFPSVKLRDLV